MNLSRLAALSLVATLALTGCSGGDEGESDAPEGDGSSASAEGQSEDEEPGIISPEDLPEVPTFANEGRGVIADVEVEDCGTEPGEVAANGTATNSGRFARDIVVVMNWAVTSTSDVVARGIATLEDVEPGDTEDWEVEAEFDVDEPVGCVPTALAGQLED